MQSVFVSSVQRDFEEQRAAARGAIESLGLRAVMAETVGASPDPSRTALLNHVSDCDAMVLILAGRYGYVGESGNSPTEDEFDRAVELGKPVLVFVQEGVEREPRQQQFIDKVRGSWEEGVYAPGFSTPVQLANLVTRTVREQQDQAGDDRVAMAAEDAARRLAGETSRRGQVGSGIPLRVVFVPLGKATLLDALALEDAALENTFSDIVRRHQLVPHSAGFEVTTAASGMRGVGKDPKEFTSTTVALSVRGEILIESDVSASSPMGLGGMALADERVINLVQHASAAAVEIWQLIDPAGRVRRVAATLGVPDAAHKVYATVAVGNTLSMGFSGPSEIVAPDPPALLRRNDVGSDDATRRLVASLRRAFSDMGAVHR